MPKFTNELSTTLHVVRPKVFRPTRQTVERVHCAPDKEEGITRIPENTCSGSEENINQSPSLKKQHKFTNMGCVLS